MTSVLQPWVQELPMMQQTVLLTAVRGPDGLPKYHPTKYVLRWYRRCILLSAMDKRTLPDPVEPNGGSFTGPSVVGHPNYSEAHHYACVRQADQTTDSVDFTWYDTWQEAMSSWVDQYLRCLDEVPHHFQMHFMHAAEIVGYQHPVHEIQFWWHDVYLRLVHDMHLWPEKKHEMNARLGDERSTWLERADPATQD